MKKFVLAACVLFLTACATQPPLVKQTASGYPEGTFVNTSLDDARSKIIGACSAKGVLVQEANGNQVLCGKTMDGQDGVWAQMLIGNSSSTTPERKVRFILYQVGKDVRVTAQQWIETQMARGQTQRMELNENSHRNNMQQFLNFAGAN
ncbi:hypothetical protein [Acidovorax sp. GW101-3H11]|uniref:hypothetical protein n=1 Tax=Acidovorax sp. GW101-3H11 TaxID=1813946 RepID=UPI0018FE0DF7|nr:hypothetical protein [Acidovorax sp. GW101-3H11]